MFGQQLVKALEFVGEIGVGFLALLEFVLDLCDEVLEFLLGAGRFRREPAGIGKPERQNGKGGDELQFHLRNAID